MMKLLARIPVPGLNSFLMMTYLQLNSCWIPLRNNCHYCTIRIYCHACSCSGLEVFLLCSFFLFFLEACMTSLHNVGDNPSHTLCTMEDRSWVQDNEVRKKKKSKETMQRLTTTPTWKFNYKSKTTKTPQIILLRFQQHFVGFCNCHGSIIM